MNFLHLLSRALVNFCQRADNTEENFFEKNTMYCSVGRAAPQFEASCVDPESGTHRPFKLSDELANYRGGILLFFYPLNFTFVCPTELVALSDEIEKFESLGVRVATVSVDSAHAHSAWRSISREMGGIGNVNFCMISDPKRSISRDYGVLSEGEIALRASVFIDQEGVIRYLGINDLPIGRNIDELVRIISAYQHYKEHGEVCPINWRKGQSGMLANQDSVRKYLRNSVRSEESSEVFA